jgi:hypothetical protein
MARALVSVGGYDLPTPSSYTGNTADIVDSARNVQGRVVGSVIRHDVAKVTLEWKYLTVEQWSNILKRFNPNYGGSFYNNVTFFNQVSATWETRLMYVSDRTSAGLIHLSRDGSPQGYTNPNLSLVEV